MCNAKPARQKRKEKKQEETNDERSNLAGTV